MIKIMYKTISWLSIFVFACMAMVCAPITVMAETVGAFEVTGGTNGTDYNYSDRTLTILTDTEIVIANTNPETSTADRIEIVDGVSANLILDGVNIDVAHIYGAAAIKIADNSEGKVKITLIGNNILKSGSQCAGLQKEGTNGTLEITGTGSLLSRGGEDGAGIGGGFYGAGSGIVISGGSVTAMGGNCGAGIGGGQYGVGSEITISGGEVRATGGIYASGIGGGACEDGSKIIISGGVVTAIGGACGAGIGGGDIGDGSEIIICGGSVKVYSGNGANVIGGGKSKAEAMPTQDGTNVVYPFVIENVESADVIIDDQYYPNKHFDEKRVYVYLTGDVEHSVKIGEIEWKCKYSSYSSSFQIYENIEDVPRIGMECFVERMYTVALGRMLDVKGFIDWVNQLEAGTNDGAGIAFGFIRSEEFSNRALSDEDYLTTLYKTFFDRKPDEEGYNNWLAQLNDGKTREYVLAQFVNSDEFMNLCNKFGVARGYMLNDGSYVSVGVSKFVARLYTVVLGRNPEAGGYNEWVAKIVGKVTPPGDVAAGFFNSMEYINKNNSDEDYVKALYMTFFDRVPSNGEDMYWIEQLHSGTPRADIIRGFANSLEFSSLLARYGLL